MTDIIDSVQIQEIDDALIELFDITLPDGVTVVRFMNGLDEGIENIYFPQATAVEGVFPLHEYIAIPIELTGVSVSSSGALARPTLSTVNFPTLSRSYLNNSDGTFDETTLLDVLEDNGIHSNQDLLNSRVVYRRTLFKYTYKYTDSNPSSPPVEFPSVKYIFDRVASEDNILVSFELASPMDVEGVTVPNRVVIGKYCPWKYQGANLDGDGGCNWDLDSRGAFFDKDNNTITRDISTIPEFNVSSTYSQGARVKTITNGHTQIWKSKRAVPAGKNPPNFPYFWYREDVCGKLITSCKIRFQNTGTDGQFNTSKPLPFGGFPGARTFK